MIPAQAETASCDPSVSKPRHLDELDLLKFLAILGMIIVHIFECWILFLDDVGIGRSPLEIFMEMYGGPLCAPILMLCMGICVHYTRHDKPKDFVRRGLILLAVGYALSFFRETVLLMIDGASFDELMGSFLAVDILQLAGLSFILLGVLKRFGCTKWHILIAAIAMFIVSCLAGHVDVTGVPGQLLGLFVMTSGKHICFPLLGWFVYVAAGVFIGSYLHDMENHDRIYGLLFAVGIVFFTVTSLYTLFAGDDFCNLFFGDLYFLQDPRTVLWILGIDFMYFPIAYFLVSRLGTDGSRRFFGFFGKNLYKIYIIQWLIIGWSCGMTYLMEMTLPIFWAVPLGIAVYAVSSALVPVLTWLSEKIPGRFSGKC